MVRAGARKDGKGKRWERVVTVGNQREQDGPGLGRSQGLWPGINFVPRTRGCSCGVTSSRQLAPATDHEAHLGDEKGNKVM